MVLASMLPGEILEYVSKRVGKKDHHGVWMFGSVARLDIPVNKGKAQQCIS